MEIFIFWLGLSVAIGVWASNKGRNGFLWFLLGVVISPILAAIFLAVSADLSKPSSKATAIDHPSPQTHVQCPDCAELVRNEARVCKHCGCKLIPTPIEAATKAGIGDLTVRQIVGICLALLVAYAVYQSR